MYILIAIVLIITAIDWYGLYCSSVSLLKTLYNPNSFCKFSGKKINHSSKTFIFNIGVVFHYFIVNMALWWFFHVAIFFHKVFFPFQANRFEKLGRDKYIFATVIILCEYILVFTNSEIIPFLYKAILLPLPAVIICLSVD